ncbi:hypothetical protein EUZ85_05665 [Hahella sp. KA22]|uniref:DUF2971 domain-containing protein n=1 Tax=Hahella sp. KA22 TaxID=1628392 RepID=UPI000FDD5534|nr:DUF2971 domain-containing protein [Hahella sp. KA22]AZZ90229.1 hypothetical protein ENC22_03115 [Hahella sp. KA22]QAY53599.1 hypothetical protein EUZ85_05665 [Hahella sp. KA22]
MKLYLYADKLSITILREGKLPFRGLDGLHDPFLSPELPLAAAPVRDITQAEFVAEVKRQYDALPEELSSLVTFEYYLQQAKHKRKEIEAILLQGVANEPLFLNPRFMLSLGVLGLFETVESLVLWRCQGDRHRGVALEIDPDKAGLMDGRYQDSPQTFKKVEYCDERPQTGAFGFSPLFQCSTEFSGEGEWRLLRPLDTGQKQILWDGEALSLCKFPSNAISAIMFGCAVDPELRDALTHLLQVDMRYRQLRTFQMKMSASRFRLSAEPLN